MMQVILHVSRNLVKLKLQIKDKGFEARCAPNKCGKI